MKIVEQRVRQVRLVLAGALSVLLFFVLEHLAYVFLPGHPVFGQLVAALVAGPLAVAAGVRLSARSLRQERIFRDALEHSVDDFYLFEAISDEAGAVTDFQFGYMNAAAERRLKSSRGEYVGKVLSETRPYAVSSGVLERYKEVLLTGVPYVDEIFIDDDTIQKTWIHVHAIKLGNRVAVTSRDFTERKQASDHVKFLAHHDQLTGLPNRTLLHERLNSAILRARRGKHKVAVLMLDLDHFKGINDSLGHAVGDALLIAVGKRLLGSVRESDTVARLGGDEFVIVLPDLKCMEDVQQCGQKILETVGAPILIGDLEVVVTVSIGLCIFPDSGVEVEQILEHADAAMYRVKAAGRNGVTAFVPAAVSPPAPMGG